MASSAQRLLTHLFMVAGLPAFGALGTAWRPDSTLIKPPSMNTSLVPPPSFNTSLVVPPAGRQLRQVANSKHATYCHPYSPAHPKRTVCYLDAPRVCRAAPTNMDRYACVFVVTKLTDSYIDTIILSVRRLRTRTRAWIIVIAPKNEPEVPPAALSRLQKRMQALDRKTMVYLHAWPAAPAGGGHQSDVQLESWFVDVLRQLPNCCGWREYFKLIAWKLNAFKRVILLDLDVQVLANLDHLFGCPEDIKAMYVAGPSGPWQGGFFVATPSRGVYDEMLRRLRAPQYSPAKFWFNTVGQLHKQYHGDNCYGCEGPQGFLYWFFVLRKNNLLVGELDSCVYDAINPHNGCLDFWKEAKSAQYHLKSIHKFSTVHSNQALCRSQAAVIAGHVRRIVGYKDAKTLFFVRQCGLASADPSVVHAYRREGGSKLSDRGVSVQTLCQAHKTCAVPMP